HARRHLTADSSCRPLADVHRRVPERLRRDDGRIDHDVAPRRRHLLRLAEALRQRCIDRGRQVSSVRSTGGGTMKSTDISVRSASGLAGVEIGRRGLLQAGGIGAMLALLSGCAPTGGGRPSDSLTFTSWTFAGRSVGPVQAAAELYTRQTGVPVETKVYPFDRYLNQLVLAA